MKYYKYKRKYDSENVEIRRKKVSGPLKENRGGEPKHCQRSINVDRENMVTVFSKKKIC